MAETITKKEIKEILAEQTKELDERFEQRLDERFEENNKKLLENFSEVFVTKTDLEDFKQVYREEFAKMINPIDKKADEEDTERIESPC